jgi:hypothetical protein
MDQVSHDPAQVWRPGQEWRPGIKADCPEDLAEAADNVFWIAEYMAELADVSVEAMMAHAVALVAAHLSRPANPAEDRA